MPRSDRSNSIRTALRESLLILATWAFFAVWVCGGAAWLLLNQPSEPTPAEPAIVLGLPRWVFWTVALPWLLATVVTLAISRWVISDEPNAERNDD